MNLGLRASGMTLDNSGSNTDGHRCQAMVLWNLPSGNLNQRWTATSVGSGYYNLILFRAAEGLGQRRFSTTAGIQPSNVASANIPSGMGVYLFFTITI